MRRDAAVCVALCYGVTLSLTRLSAGAAARRTGERISFHYLISQKYTGDQAGNPTLIITLHASTGCRRVTAE